MKPQASNFVTGTVTSIQELGEGMRVCLDLVDLLAEDEGICIGNTGHGYLLALAETRTTQTYPPRPFRVNGGAVHQYVQLGEKTTYLCELEPGMKIQVYSPEGSREVAIGRVKIEKRPLRRIELQCGEQVISITVQASDSIHLMGEDSEAIPANSLQEGDKLLCLPDEPGRHLGSKIQEFIIEK
jgi:3-dehydroquinate synthase II